jgi:hypothetical protein
MDSSEKIESVLRNLEYPLIDRGDYWQSTAVYRSGDNPQAVQIFKSSGVWKDYVAGDSYMPFSVLVEKTVGKDSAKSILSDPGFLNVSPQSEQQPVNLQSETVFNSQEFKNLLPHYQFYNKKKISNETLKFFHSGMCTAGSMYQRYVFPVFNKFQKIHGVAGRDMLNSSNRPKWKHMGKKSSWAYPLYAFDAQSNSFPILDSIQRSKELILVESVGDMLALYEHGYDNCLVTFGTSISPHLCSIIMGLSPDNICISLNNDNKKSRNVGRESAIKSFLKLLNFFGSDKLNICLPTKNDFGDMTDSDFENWSVKKNINYNSNSKICNQIYTSSKILFSENKISKNLFNNIKYLPNYE